MSPPGSLFALEWPFLADKHLLALMIPIVAIVAWGCIAIVGLLLRHRERMAMIERGINPDNPPEADEPKEEEEPG